MTSDGIPVGTSEIPRHRTVVSIQLHPGGHSDWPIIEPIRKQNDNAIMPIILEWKYIYQSSKEIIKKTKFYLGTKANHKN